ncbi:FMRFamide receptor [Brachionus plicatilis]|uniref:FMRFamide receptor n=1 Tax=Brachionus plicatilis TaxID=10195 RepID=A0A3M7T4K0_BRAPC|nr:FMRFamide receptor [Brachionus plicatilis]
MTNECNGQTTCKVENIILTILSIFALLVTVFGNIFNLISFYICRNQSLKSNTTFIILSIIFLFEALTLNTWNLDIFLQIFPRKNDRKYNIDNHNIIESSSVFTCKIFTFTQYFSLHSISWLMSLMTVDQVVKIYFPKNSFQKPKLIKKIIFCILLILFLANSHILLFAGVVNNFKFSKKINVNGTWLNETVVVKQIDCYSSSLYQFYPIWDRIHLFLYCFIPFSLMMACNLFMVRKILFYPSTLNHRRSVIVKRRTISFFIIAHSLMFMACSLPSIVSYGFYFYRLKMTRFGEIVLVILDEIIFSFFAFNFLAHLVMNKIYRKEFKRTMSYWYSYLVLK